MTIVHEVFPHPRFIEFENSRFYAQDFNKLTFKFLTFYDLEEKVLGEYAHTKVNEWVSRDNRVLSCGQLIVEIDTLSNEPMYVDLYVNDFYKRQHSITVKRVYRYLLTPTGETKRCHGGDMSLRGHVFKLYDLKPVDDMSSIGTLSQIIPAI